jgi:hypothetical protein
MKTALVEAEVPVYNKEKKDYSNIQMNVYFINEEGSISNETGDSHVKNCESYEAALAWLKQFIPHNLHGEVTLVLEGP